ncbi:MAG: hypothetical protein ACTSRZ_01340 [Promethearchaeota archaeon]
MAENDISSNGMKLNLDLIRKKIFYLRLICIICSLVIIVCLLFGNVKNFSNFRILSDIIQNLAILILVICIFFPNKLELKRAFFLGLFIMAFDFVLETVAVLIDWWYPLGGI